MTNLFIYAGIAATILCCSAPVAAKTLTSSPHKLTSQQTVEVTPFKYRLQKEWVKYSKYGVEHHDWVAFMTACTDEVYLESELVVPDFITVEGVRIPVVAIDKVDLSQSARARVKTMTLGKNVKMVSMGGGWNALTTVNLNDSLRVIESNTFAGTGITSITIPKNVKYIGSAAFERSALKEIHFENAAPNDTIGLTIDASVFNSCKSLTSVTLPAHTVSVGLRAFSSAPALKEILVEDECENMFSDNGVLYQKVGDHYDALCYPIGREATVYYLPEILSGGRIRPGFLSLSGYMATDNPADDPAQKLKRLDFSRLTSPITINQTAITAFNIDKINIQNVDSLEEHSLNLKTAEITIGTATRYIHPRAFGSVRGKFKVENGNGHYVAAANGSLLQPVEGGFKLVRVHDISASTYYYIPDDIVELGEYSFEECTNLKSIVFSKNLHTIGKSAFFNAEKLNTVNIGDAILDYVASDAFTNTPWLRDLPNGPVYLGDVMYTWRGQGAVDVDDSPLTIKEDTRIISPSCFSNYSRSESLQHQMSAVTLPDTMEKIHENAFNRNKKLTSINFPEGLTHIGISAFYMTGLTSVSLPTSMKSVGANAFAELNNLKTLRIGGDTEFPSTILGDNAFTRAYNASSLYIGGSVKSIGEGTFEYFASAATPIDLAIPESVETIGNYAFRGANIRNLTIGSGVRSIGYGAFMISYNPNENPNGSHTLSEDIPATSIQIKAMTPPQPLMEGINANIEPAFFSSEFYASTPLFVPVGKVAEYKAAPGWSQFRRILNEGDDASVEGVRADDANAVSVAVRDGSITVVAPETTDVTVVSLEGRTVHSGKGSATVSAAPGIYIVSAGAHVTKHIVK